MKKNGFCAWLAAIALVSLSFGCDTATNTNTNANTYTNRVVVTNANTGNANVANINANITREEFERSRERFEREAREAGRRIGSGAQDLWLWTKTRSALAYADDLRDVTINVDVENEEVTLSGTVANTAQRTRAEEIARSIEGVRNVRNQLVVSAGSGNANQTRNMNTR